VQRRAEDIAAVLRAPQLSQPAGLTAACAAAVTSLTQVIAAFSEQIGMLEQQVDASFRRHTAAGICLSQPGLGAVLAARILGEFGDDPHRYASAKSRKNYASTNPITRASGKRTAVLARYARNDRLAVPSTGGRSPHCAPHRVPAATTASCAAAARPTAPRRASSATGWSASCTAA
jgi:transposase